MFTCIVVEVGSEIVNSWQSDVTHKKAGCVRYMQATQNTFVPTTVVQQCPVTTGALSLLFGKKKMQTQDDSFRVQRKSVLQFAIQASCSYHVLAQKSFQLAPTKLLTCRIGSIAVL